MRMIFRTAGSLLTSPGELQVAAVVAVVHVVCEDVSLQVVDQVVVVPETLDLTDLKAQKDCYETKYNNHFFQV